MQLQIHLNRNKKYVIFSLFIALISLLFTAVASKALAYFHTKSTQLEAYHPDIAVERVHTPKISWQEDEDAEGREMDEATKQRITEDYIAAWYEWNRYIQTGDSSRLHDFFHRDILHKMPSFTPKAPLTKQIDIKHTIDLHLYSEDGQAVAFTDKSLTYIRQGFTSIGDSATPSLTKYYHNDLEAVMVLDDGNWKIKNWEYKPAEKEIQAKPNPSKGAFFSIKDQKLRYKGEIFECRGMNYYPKAHPWEMWGEHFDRNVIRKDFELMHSLQFNTARIFLPFEDLGKGNVDLELLSQIEMVLDEAAATDMKLIVTLFDFNSDYRLNNWVATDRQLETILETFKDREEIIAYDIKNEPDLDFRHSPKKLVLDWLDFTLKKAKEYDPNHLITIGWADAANAHLFSDKVDFVAFHFYKDIRQLAPDIDSLQKKVGIQLIMLEEFGMSTFRAWWYNGKTEAEQAQYYQQILSLIQKKENMPFVVWTLYDFADIPKKVAGALPQDRYPQKKFGIVDENLHTKPVYQILKTYLKP